MIEQSLYGLLAADPPRPLAAVQGRNLAEPSKCISDMRGTPRDGNYVSQGGDGTSPAKVAPAPLGRIETHP